MAVKGIFLVGFTEAEILQILDQAKQMLIEGKTIMSYGAEGTSVSKSVFAGMRPDQVMLECQHALRKINPASYPPPKRFVQANLGGSFTR
jgi:hypothetical protein